MYVYVTCPSRIILLSGRNDNVSLLVNFKCNETDGKKLQLSLNSTFLRSEKTVLNEVTSHQSTDFRTTDSKYPVFHVCPVLPTVVIWFYAYSSSFGCMWKE